MSSLECDRYRKWPIPKVANTESSRWWNHPKSFSKFFFWLISLLYLVNYHLEIAEYTWTVVMKFMKYFLHLILLGIIITWHFHLLHLFAFQDLYMTHQIVLPELIFDFRIFIFLEFLPGLSHTLPNTIFIKNNNLKCILVF